MRSSTLELIFLDVLDKIRKYYSFVVRCIFWSDLKKIHISQSECLSVFNVADQCMSTHTCVFKHYFYFLSCMILDLTFIFCRANSRHLSACLGFHDVIHSF